VNTLIDVRNRNQPTMFHKAKIFWSFQAARGLNIIASITAVSTNKLGLKFGADAFALIKQWLCC